jgi:hypothetical protein
MLLAGEKSGSPRNAQNEAHPSPNGILLVNKRALVRYGSSRDVERKTESLLHS